mgnify:CR=1 FL=1
MLRINPKYQVKILPKDKPKEEDEQMTYNSNVMNGKGLNELISRVKDLKIKEINKKVNTGNKITF